MFYRDSDVTYAPNMEENIVYAFLIASYYSCSISF